MNDMSNFRYIWINWINPLIKDLYAQTDKKFVEYCKVEIRDLDNIYNNAEKYYQRKREEVKRTFYGEYHKGDSQLDHRMDFHKISAIICRTFIEYKVYNFDEVLCQQYVDKNIDSYDTDWVVRNALINYRLAFYSSVVFLFHAMQFEYYTEDKELFDLLEKESKLNLYETHISNNTKVKESFENCIILDLAKRDINNHSFDYFMYAIIMYQLEEHNKNYLYNKDKAIGEPNISFNNET